MSAAAPALTRLHELLEREAEAIEAADAEALEALGRERDELLAALPPLVAADRELALGVEALRARNEAAATEALAGLGRLLANVDRGRDVVRGYAPASTARYLDHEA